MAKSSVMLAAVMMGAVAIISPAQAVILSQESPQQIQEENASSLIAHKNRSWRRKYCWRRYGRVRCRHNRDYDRWHRQRKRDRQKWRRDRDRYWRKRRRWEKHRHDDDYWNRRDREYEIWRRRKRQEGFRDKLERWIYNGNKNDDDDDD
ncbi:hypothetical protein [Acaryochloris sp. IP29b_bin.137]|uniref:hypothetical protein n=1 Tax=Acaryochloris sp. IP29b_bin.137 TaxID=2969217 RepID=UPI0026273BF4|nr:hypothetical protein [Acaryochloris sp. IP29b_bin.137]